MEKTWKPTVAGILDITIAVVSLWFLLALSLEGAVFWSVFPRSLFGLNSPSTVYMMIVLPLICMAALAFTGGIYALRRRKWGLGLAGSIAAFFCLAPIGFLLPGSVYVGIPVAIFIIVLIARSRGEFERKAADV